MLNYGFWILNYGLWTRDEGLGIRDYEFWNPDLGQGFVIVAAERSSAMISKAGALQLQNASRRYVGVLLQIKM